MNDFFYFEDRPSRGVFKTTRSRYIPFMLLSLCMHRHLDVEKRVLFFRKKKVFIKIYTLNYLLFPYSDQEGFERSLNHHHRLFRELFAKKHEFKASKLQILGSIFNSIHF